MTSFGDRMRTRMRAPLDSALGSEMRTALDELFAYPGFIEFIDEQCSEAVDIRNVRYERFTLYTSHVDGDTTLSCWTTFKPFTITRSSTSALCQQWSNNRRLRKDFMRRLARHFDGVDIECVVSGRPETIAFVITWAREPETATVLSRLARLEEHSTKVPPHALGRASTGYLGGMP